MTVLSLKWKSLDLKMWFLYLSQLTYCRIYASLNYVIIGLDNGLAPNRRQAII